MSEVLLKKLGIKPYSVWAVLGAPQGFIDGLDPLPEGCLVTDAVAGSMGRIIFAVTVAQLLERFDGALDRLEPTGCIWVAWPKKSSGVVTELAFDTVQTLGLSSGLVDNKICAIDETWTALRFVVPIARRADWNQNQKP